MKHRTIESSRKRTESEECRQKWHKSHEKKKTIDHASLIKTHFRTNLTSCVCSFLYSR